MPGDEAFLLDMLLWGQECQALIAGATWEAFVTNRAMQLSVVYTLQTVGEAARKVSAGTRAEHTEIPWERIIGMRHRLVHDYGRVDLVVAWNTAVVAVPALIAALEPLIPPERPE